MRVSVATITYNHERWISQTVDSVLVQDFDGPLEMVVGDDASTDRTVAILEEKAARHPGRIRILRGAENVGLARNFARTLRACRGEYVALLDGDDYFLSPEKIRRQVDYLDRHPELSACFHTVLNARGESGETRELRPPGARDRYGLADLAFNNVAASCGVLYRSGLFDDFPDWFVEAPLVDWPLHVLNAAHGDMGFLDEPMAVHRVHDRGIWGGAGRIGQIGINLETRAYIRAHLGPAYEDRCRAGDFKDTFELGKQHERAGDLAEAARCLRRCRATLSHRGEISPWKFWRRYARVLAKARLKGGGDREPRVRSAGQRTVSPD